jgi:hypothetical protein
MWLSVGQLASASADTVSVCIGAAICSPADAVASTTTSDVGESAKDAAKDAGSDLKAKAKSVIKGNSAILSNMAVVADLNSDVRGDANDYRDPAAAVQQDTAAGE